MKLAEVAQLVDGRIEGADADTEIRCVSTLTQAGPDELAFLVSRRFAEAAALTRAAAILVSPALARLVPERPRIVTGNVWRAVLEIQRRLCPESLPSPGIHPSANVAPDAVVGPGVSIGPKATVCSGVTIGEGTVVGMGVFVGEGAIIGAGCRIHPRAVILDKIVIDDGAEVHSGAAIGGDGFKYEMLGGRRVKIPPVGTVHIGRQGEIGARNSIDRASYTVTRVGEGVKIDNLVNIGHNVTLGENSVIVAQTGIAGSVHVGREVRMGGQVGVADNVTIGEGAEIGAKSGVPGHVPAGARHWGIPARDLTTWGRILYVFKRLGPFQSAIRDLTERVDRLLETRGQGG